MRLLLLGSILLSLGSTSSGYGEHPRTSSACQVAHDAARLIGKRVRVEGYIWNLSSHGFVLAGRRRDCRVGQLRLWTDSVDGSAIWQKVFRQGLGPNRAILVGTVRWHQARFGDGHNPGLRVERIEYLSQREANVEDF